MNIDVTIKAGRHSPHWLWRLRHLRVWPLMWPFRVPDRFTLEDMDIQILHAGEWVDIFAASARITPTSPLRLLETVFGPAMVEQKNKIGGVAWGFPRKTSNGKSWHPNSCRKAFDLQGGCWDYDYVDGVAESYGKLPPWNPVTMFRQICFPKWCAYFLMPYIGGTLTLPCDVRIRYKITFLF